MFKSKILPIIIPQYEHENLAGTLAAAWGNSDFEKPRLDFGAFVQGVALHDWHYGVLDTLPIGSASETDWLAAVRKGVDHSFDHPITDVVVKLHIKRLLAGHSTPEARDMSTRLEQAVQSRIAETVYTRLDFEWADKITNFCDHLAFSFSFGELTGGKVGVYAHAGDSKLTQLTYQIQPEGRILLHPWPFSSDAVSGILLAYHEEGYPQDLKPEVLRYWLETA